MLALLLLAQLEVAPEQHLNRARVCIGTLDFGCAERALSAVRASLEQIDPELAKEALLLSAEAALSTSRFDQAEEHLLQLLIRSPKFAPKEGAWPPRWLEVLAAARKRVPDRSPPAIRVAPLDPTVDGSVVVVRASIDDPSGVDRATLHLNDPPLAIAMTSTGGAYFAVIPAERVRPPAVRFRIQAFDAHQNGGESSELEVRVTEPIAIVAPADDPSITEQWWFWTIVGIAAAGAIAGVAIAATSSDSRTVTARLTWP